MDHARIAELLQPFLADNELTTSDLVDISMYIDILQRWNARVNLTAIRDPEEIVTRHFGESLFTARNLFPLCNAVSSVMKDFDVRTRLADVGSGAGFPGIPIKLWAPQIELTLIESSHKKATFLKEVARALTLTNTDIQNTRAETIETRYDVVTLRAVERFETILPIAANLVVPAGRLALLVGSSQVPEAKSQLSRFRADNPMPIPQSACRMLLICYKQ